MGTSWACEADWHLCNEDGEGLAKEYYAASSKTRSSAQMLMCHIYTDLREAAAVAHFLAPCTVADGDERQREHDAAL